jgi:RNA polymerase sigma factor, sigma-70 family
MMDYDQLIELIAEKNMIALETLYNNMYSDVFAYSLSVVRNPVVAQDLAQDTFLRVYKGAKGFRKKGYGRAWVLKIARNLAMDYLKKQQHQPLEEWIVDKDSASEQGETMVYISQLLAELTAAEREIVLLRASGYSHKEIAGICKRPEGTVRWKYASAVKKLSAAENSTYERIGTGR